jgi:aminopeptidase N
MMRTDTGQVFRLEDYRPSDFLIPRTSLSFQLDPDATVVTAELMIARREGADAGAPLVLDGEDLALKAIEIDGTPLAPSSYETSDDKLVILAPPSTQNFRLTVQTEISPSSNTALMGLYRSNGVYCTQCEAEGFRRVSYFLDRPDILSVYTVRMEAAKSDAPLLLSNGNRIESGDLPDGRHYSVWQDPFPKPSYLFALVAGDLGVTKDEFVTASGRRVELGIYVEHGKEPRAAYAMDALKRSMRWDEEAFGREYDLDVFNIVAVSDFNMGAMENKGLNIFNDKYVLADAETATDAEYAGIEAIVAHEYFHNWTGNRITCRDWFQLCLKEGLTVFRDHEFSADQRSRPVKRISEVRALRTHQFPEDQGPLAHPVRPRRYREINNFYTATVYEKGSEIVRMIRTVLGPENFRRGMDLYFQRHDGEAVTIEDFLSAFEDVSGRDLSQFALWYQQSGTPNVTISTSYDQARREFTLRLEQSLPPTPDQPRKKPMHIPLAFGLVGSDGRDIQHGKVEGAIVGDGVIHLQERHQVVRFSGVAERPVLSLNRGFSAPITMSIERPQDDLLFLAHHDGDAFSRWQAANTLFTEALVTAFKQRMGGDRAQYSPNLTGLAGAFAADETLEHAFRALAMTLPGEADIAREVGSNIDPDIVFSVRETLHTSIAQANDELFRRLYDALEFTGSFSPDAASAGRRALRNQLLDYLATLPEGADIAERQFAAATNMTDRAAALAALVHRHGETAQAKSALAIFEERYRSDPLVLDKWLTIQATAPGPATLGKVRALMTYPGFSMSNPNRVRALIGAFASANQTAFNRADGAGYDFFAEAVVEIDRRNPQLAARLATALRSWQSLEPVRQAKAKEALLLIAGSRDLSTDLRDIVERTLG